MNPTIIVTGMLIYGIGNLVLGFFMGKYHERMEWNKLIEAGKIPRPIRKG